MGLIFGGDHDGVSNPPGVQQGFFTLGVHYWPSRKGVYWWQDFDPVEVERDFKGLRSLNIRLIRVHLMWEDFQPQPEQVSSQALLALREVLDLASRYRLKVQVSFFSGHVAGVNFLPPWLLAEQGGHRSPYPVFSAGSLLPSARVHNLFSDPVLLEAQQRLLTDVVEAFHRHAAVYGWDLGGGLNRLYPTSARKLADLSEPIGTLQWVGRTGRDQVTQTRGSRQLWMGSVLDEEVQQESEADLGDVDIIEESAEAPEVERRAPLVRPLPATAAPGHQALLGVSDGLVIFDAEPTQSDAGVWSEHPFAAATPSREQLARTLKAPDKKSAQKKEKEAAAHALAAVAPAAAEAMVVESVLEAEPDPPTSEEVVAWLKLMTAAIRRVDQHHAISLSVESQVVDSSTSFQLDELAPLVDFVGVRAHPFESKWARSPIDTKALPFLAFFGEAVTGKRIALLELGLPAVREEVYHAGRLLPYSVVHDQEAADLSADVLEGLLRMGGMGGFCWNYADFHPSLWSRPPLAQSPAYRFCGLVRLDGSLKPSAHVVRDFVTWDHPLLDPPFYVKIQPDSYRSDPRAGLTSLFTQFLEAVGDL